MNIALGTSLALSVVALASLAGCASDADPEDSSNDEVVAAPDVSHLVPQQTNTGGGTSSCTTTRSCDANYCCTTETCQFSTFVLCVPRKVNKSGTVMTAQ